jgi:hypothetical protein
VAQYEQYASLSLGLDLACLTYKSEAPPRLFLELESGGYTARGWFVFFGCAAFYG